MKAIIIIFILLVIILALYLFLIAPRRKKPDMSRLYGVNYAHRGLHDNETFAPENTMPAFLRAVEAGYGIELDVQMTKDGQVVVAHDFHLKRICGIDLQINELTYEELKQYPILKSDERIPLFTDVLRLVGGRVPLIVELKCRNGSDPIACKADEILKQYQGVYCIESFDPRALRWYRIHRPDVVRGQLSGNLNKEGAKGVMKIVYFLLTHLLANAATRPDFIAYDIRYSRELSRRLCRRMGGTAVAWTVRTEEEYRKAQKEYDLIIFEKIRPAALTGAGKSV